MSSAQGHNKVPLVRLKPTTPRFRVKHSSTEPLRSPVAIALDAVFVQQTAHGNSPELQEVQA